MLVALLLGSVSARAGLGAVHDNAAFFSETAKSEATRHIIEIDRRFKKDLLIETFKEVPADVKQGVDLTDKAAANRMFEQWTVKQARQHGVNGIYVLISREPAHLQIVVGNETQRRAFTQLDRDNLAGTMRGKLKLKQYDEALLAAVNFVSTTMASHAEVRAHPVPAPAVNGARSESGTSWGWVIPVLLGVGVIWLVVAVFRAMSGGGGGAGGGASPVSSGGGFMSSLLGGMFGAAAGMWLYDQFSGSHGSAWGSNQDSQGGNEGGFSGRDSDFSGSGGDFSDSSGGGDSGGGDSGGDSGGGDF
jgi:uncharacterized protein